MTQDDQTGEREVGLGRVVEDHLSTGSPDPGDPGGPDAPETMREDAPGAARRVGDPAGDVTEGSDLSFPASDPPPFMSDPATPRDRDQATLPDDAAG